jgi:hypothetical protein
LVDAKHVLGHVAVQRTDQGLVIGEFSPDDSFAVVEQLFRDYEEAVDQQALSIVDALDARIAGLGLHVVLPDGRRVKIDDVQIWCDGAISFRPSMQGGAVADTDVEIHPAKR